MQLLPQDEKFFTLLAEQSSIVLEAASALAEGMRGTDSLGTAQHVRDLERKGEEVLRNIYRRLHKTFITPIDPEDIHHLASEVDKILDHIDAVAYRLDAYEMKRPTGPLVEIAVMLEGCVGVTHRAMQFLEKEGVKKPDELTTLCEEINRQEIQTEERVRAAIRELFANERDVISLIKQKEIYELLESAADSCETVADALEGVAVKNS